MTEFVIDLSKNNGKPNLDLTLKNPTKITRVICKATEGVGYIDPMMKVNAPWAKKVGYKVSYYHFATLNSKDVVKDATAEANCFLNAIKDMPENDFELALDIEREDMPLSKEDFLLWIKTFFAVLDKAGKKYMIYSGKYFLDENLPANHGLGHIPLWLAQYPTTPVTATSQPKLPNGWSEYKIWQYSDHGQIIGITGNVDVNRLAA